MMNVNSPNDGYTADDLVRWIVVGVFTFSVQLRNNAEELLEILFGENC